MKTAKEILDRVIRENNAWITQDERRVVCQAMEEYRNQGLDEAAEAVDFRERSPGERFEGDMVSISDCMGTIFCIDTEAIFQLKKPTTP